MLELAEAMGAIQTHQQWHDKFVKVDHLNTAHVELHFAIDIWSVCIPSPLSGFGCQTHAEAEHLIANDGDGLENQK